MNRLIKHYVFVVWGDVEPELFGPYSVAADRDTRARDLKMEHRDSHGIYAMDMERDELKVYSWSAGFFEDDGDPI